MIRSTSSASGPARPRLAIACHTTARYRLTARLPSRERFPVSLVTDRRRARTEARTRIRLRQVADGTCGVRPTDRVARHRGCQEQDPGNRERRPGADWSRRSRRCRARPRPLRSRAAPEGRCLDAVGTLAHHAELADRFEQRSQARTDDSSVVDQQPGSPPRRRWWSQGGLQPPRRCDPRLPFCASLNVCHGAQLATNIRCVSHHLTSRARSCTLRVLGLSERHYYFVGCQRG